MVASDNTVQKITALEDELNRLRAQIAGFVLKQDNTTSMCNNFFPELSLGIEASKFIVTNIL